MLCSLDSTLVAPFSRNTAIPSVVQPRAAPDRPCVTATAPHSTAIPASGPPDSGSCSTTAPNRYGTAMPPVIRKIVYCVSPPRAIIRNPSTVYAAVQALTPNARIAE